MNTAGASVIAAVANALQGRAFLFIVGRDSGNMPLSVKKNLPPPGRRP